ncbi:MAG: type II secretion system F family protein [Armatimonadota bacterium]|nr:type II secretion system F family protein [Armatimonadota bacterium]
MDVALIAVLVFASAFTGGMALLLRRPEQQAVADRLLALEQQRSPRAAVLALPFHKRVLLPAAQQVVQAATRFLPPRSLAEVEKNLVMAGRRRADPVVWVLRKYVLTAAAAVLAFVLARYARWPVAQQFVFTLAAGGLGYLWPELTLRRAILDRQARIVRELPETLDLLTISVEAGLGLDQALETVAMRRHGPLSDEIRAYLDEIRLGRDRHEALKALGARTGVEDLISLTATLVQAMEYGVSIATVLRVQADEVRTRRRQRIEERAMKAPVKMLFPLIFLILPALFVVVAGPGLIRAYAEFIRPGGPSGTFGPPRVIR